MALLLVSLARGAAALGRCNPLTRGMFHGLWMSVPLWALILWACGAF